MKVTWRTDSAEIPGPYVVTRCRRGRSGSLTVTTVEVVDDGPKRTMDDQSVLAWCRLEDLLDVIPPYQPPKPEPLLSMRCWKATELDDRLQARPSRHEDCRHDKCGCDCHQFADSVRRTG